jgi:hypothetical protein
MAGRLMCNRRKKKRVRVEMAVRARVVNPLLEAGVP